MDLSFLIPNSIFHMCCALHVLIPNSWFQVGIEFQGNIFLDSESQIPLLVNFRHDGLWKQ